MTGSTVAQTLTITGSGFTAGTGLAVELISGVTATSYGGAKITAVSATQIQVSVVPGTAAQNFTVEVVNPNGKVSNGMVLQVVAPVVTPAIGSLSPNPMHGSNSPQPLLITGTGFAAGTGWKVQLTYTGTATPVQATQVSVVSATQIQAMVNVGTVARTWSVQVVNPAGVGSKTASLSVTAPLPPPAIASLSPNPMNKASAAQTLTINGSAFQAGASVLLVSSGTNIGLSGAQVTMVSSSKLTVPVNVGAVARTWTVTVQNPDGQVSAGATLTVH